jgi:demethylmenaquinone methyltransferase/2-methoxy-6-polyprenyl-1,4-benzoquinol methylase
VKEAERKTTHFGYETLPESEKARRVGEVFDAVSARYDLMNDLMSGGMHRLWKRFALEQSGVRPGQRVLDVAGGTGDLARLFAQRTGPSGAVVLSDFNFSMLSRGRDRLTDAGIVLPVVQCDAERLPFPSGHFDCVCIGFGLRNVTRKAEALREMTRVLRPGGCVLVLEFSQVLAPLKPLYDAFSFQILPRLGRLVTGNEPSYRYLAESIRMHPSQEELKAMMGAAGLERVEYWNLTAGVVALHRGYRF